MRVFLSARQFGLGLISGCFGLALARLLAQDAHRDAAEGEGLWRPRQARVNRLLEFTHTLTLNRPIDDSPNVTSFQEP